MNRTEKRNKKAHRKRVGIIVLLVVSIIYVSGVAFFQDRFMPRTHINDMRVSGSRVEKVNRKMAQANDWDKLIIKNGDEILKELTANEIKYKYVNNDELPEIMNEYNHWLWFKELFNKTTHTTQNSYEYNKDKVKNNIYEIEEFDQKLTNASIKYSKDKKEFVIEPDKYEITIKKDDLVKKAEEKIDNRETSLNIEDDIKIPKIKKDNKELNKSKELANDYLGLEITYKTIDKKEKIDEKLIKDWITNEDTEIYLNAEKIREYVIKIAEKNDTYGKPRKFKTAAGNEITISNGSYGWLTHRANSVDKIIKAIEDKKNTEIEPYYSYEAAVRDKNDIGNNYVEIDIQGQMVYVFEDGKKKIETPTVTGDITRGHDTPTGINAISYKETNAVLRGEGYESPVKYWMPFNGGVGLHDADWRSSFGGQNYRGNGSHGCINLPPSIAKEVFDLVEPGMPVIVY